MRWKLDSLQESLLIGSTLVEGSTLTENESRQILAGKTIAGHPISEVRELLNYRSSVEWLMRELDKSPFISLDLILEFHARLFTGFPGDHGRWKSMQNFTYRSDGSRFDYEAPARVDSALRSWLEKYNTEPKTKLDPSVLVAELYYEFERIHPVEDGNGRIGRILLAYWLHLRFESLFSFQLKDKLDHLKALESANQGDLKALQSFFKKRIKPEGVS